MADPATLAGYTATDILHWLDQAKTLLEQTLARIETEAPKLGPDDRQAVTSNLVLITNVVTHLSQHVLQPDREAASPAPAPLADHPGILERLHAIHERMQAVYHRLQSGTTILN